MKTNENLMRRLALVSFALNIVSIFLPLLNQSQEKAAGIEKTAYQGDRTLFDNKNTKNMLNSLHKGFGNFPQNILT